MKFQKLVGLIAAAFAFGSGPAIAQEPTIFSATVELVRPLQKGSTVLYVLITLAEANQFELQASTEVQKALVGYTFNGDIKGMPTLRLAIEKIFRESGVRGVGYRFAGDSLVLYGSGEALAAKTADVEAVPQKKSAAPAETVTVATPVVPSAPATSPKRVAVNREFTQTQTEQIEEDQLGTVSARVATPSPVPARRPVIVPLPASSAAYAASLGPAVYVEPAPAMRAPHYYTATTYTGGADVGYSVYSQRLYGNLYTSGYGYYNPYLTAEWCANFPANRKCTHGKIKIDGPELPDVDMYLTWIDKDGRPIGPRVNKGPVSKHNSWFNRAYDVRVGWYKVEFVHKDKNVHGYEDTIEVQPSYVTDDHAEARHVDPKRFQNEPLATEIVRGKDRTITADEWKRQGGIQ
ncbi:MAG: hypothetical protein ACM3NH_03470 [Candidatus Saccharibacteria bacterium]